VLLDGNHDWFSEPRRAPTDMLAPEGLFELEPLQPLQPLTPGPSAAPSDEVIPVRTMIKADMRCSSVAAASVLAKVERDA
jgi:ribonuclease HII